MSLYEAEFLITGPEFLESRVKVVSEVVGAVSFRNQHLVVRLEAPNEQFAENEAAERAETFCTMLSARTGEHFAEVFKQLVINPGQSDERLCGASLRFSWRTVTYPADRLPDDLLAALRECDKKDRTLRKAGAYFRHGLFLSQEAWRLVPSGSFRWALSVSEAMLSYFKAASIILGDPRDRDYQSRYKGFGMPPELWSSVDRMRELRNKYDIAHYDHGWGAIEVVKQELVEAKTTTQHVIRGYAEHLRSRAAWPGPNGGCRTHRRWKTRSPP